MTNAVFGAAMNEDNSNLAENLTFERKFISHSRNTIIEKMQSKNLKNKKSTNKFILEKNYLQPSKVKPNENQEIFQTKSLIPKDETLKQGSIFKKIDYLIYPIRSESNPPKNIILVDKPIAITEIKPVTDIVSERDQCGIAVKQLIDNYPTTLPTPKTLEDSVALNIYATIIKKYADACFSKKIQSTPGDNLDENIIQQVAGIITYTIGDKDIPICPGIISDNKVYTAKHCFIDKYKQKPTCPPALSPNLCNDSSIQNSISFVRLKDLHEKLKIDASAIALQKLKTLLTEENIASLDYIKLPLINAPTDLPKVIWISPVETQSLNLFGLIPFLELTNAQKDWTQSIRWTRFLAGSCRVVKISKDGCIQHRCQSVEGFSGTPLITRTEKINGQQIVYAAGIHVGSNTAYPHCQAESNTNLAITIPDKE